LLPLVGAMMTLRGSPGGRGVDQVAAPRRGDDDLTGCTYDGDGGKLLPLVGAMMTRVDDGGAVGLVLLLPLVGAMMTPAGRAARVDLLPVAAPRRGDDDGSSPWRRRAKTAGCCPS